MGDVIDARVRFEERRDPLGTRADPVCEIIAGCKRDEAFLGGANVVDASERFEDRLRKIDRLCAENDRLLAALKALDTR